MESLKSARKEVENQAPSIKLLTSPSTLKKRKITMPSKNLRRLKAK
jgi:hypothetical protein